MPGKYAIFLHTYISITDTCKAKINEENKSIAVGPFFIGTYLEPIWTLLPKDVEPYGVSDLVTSVPQMCKTPKWIFTYSNGVVCCAKNRNPIALIVDLNFML